VPEETEYVVLLDSDGNPAGQAAKSAVHHSSTPLHLAFSLYLFDADHRLLMTRRALTKVAWPGVWTNSCCGHPQPGEAMSDAVTRRLSHELGMQVADLQCRLPNFAYRTRDAGGIWENEKCPVYSGFLVGDHSAVAPHSGEVMDWAWVPWENMISAAALTPYAFSPWAVRQISELAVIEGLSTQSSCTRDSLRSGQT